MSSLLVIRSWSRRMRCRTWKHKPTLKIRSHRWESPMQSLDAEVRGRLAENPDFWVFIEEVKARRDDWHRAFVGAPADSYESYVACRSAWQALDEVVDLATEVDEENEIAPALGGFGV